MQINLSITLQHFWYRLCDPRISSICRMACLIGLFLLCTNTFASDGNDLLSGTDSDAWATLKGTGRNYLFLGEGVIGVIAYMVTKDIKKLLGLFVVAIFINLVIFFGHHQS